MANQSELVTSGHDCDYECGGQRASWRSGVEEVNSLGCVCEVLVVWVCACEYTCAFGEETNGGSPEAVLTFLFGYRMVCTVGGLGWLVLMCRVQ